MTDPDDSQKTVVQKTEHLADPSETDSLIHSLAGESVFTHHILNAIASSSLDVLVFFQQNKVTRREIAVLWGGYEKNSSNVAAALVSGELAKTVADLRAEVK